ncbi:MAG: VWA domain-containing protein [Acidobacteriota bacterium]
MRTSAGYLLAALALAAGSAQAQEPPLILSETVDVRVVNVEVVVTDRRGQRIQQLPPEAFELRVDGEIRAIDFFQEISDGSVTRVAGPRGSLHAEGEQIRIDTLIFIDEVQAIAADRDRVLAGLERGISQLRPEDRVAVLAFDGRKLTRVVDWSTDREALRDALRRARQRPARGMERMAQLQLADDIREVKDELAQATDMLIRAEASAIGGDAGELVRDAADDFRAMMNRSEFVDASEPFDRDTAEQVRRQTREMIAAASAALRSQSGSSARKTMLLLSGSLPSSALSFVTGDGTKTVDQALSEGLEEDDPTNVFRPLFDLANTLGFTLYPVDLAGVERDLGAADANPFSSVFGSDINVETQTVVQLQVGGVSREEQGQLALELLADRTGGLALINSSANTALQRAVDDARTFYWLGFAFDTERDDASHRLEVRLKPGFDGRVRSRQTFFDPSQRTESTQIVEAGLLFGDTAGAGPLRASFSPPRRAGRRRIEIDVELTIPLDLVELVQIGARHQGQLEVRMAALGEDGQRSETSTDPLTINGDRAPRPGDYYSYRSTLTLKRLPQRIQFTVHDLIGGDVLAVASSIDPGPRP